MPVWRNLGVDRPNGNCNSLEALIKSVKKLILAVSTKPDTWNLFFLSLEKAFEKTCRGGYESGNII